MNRKFYIARIYANYEEAVRTIDLLGEYGNQDKAERERQGFSRSSSLAEHTSLMVTAGRTWAEAERELQARLGD